MTSCGDQTDAASLGAVSTQQPEVPFKPRRVTWAYPIGEDDEAMARRIECVLFTNCHKDNTRDDYYVPTTAFDNSELHDLQRLADTRDRKIFIAHWGAWPHPCWLSHCAENPDGSRICQYGKRLGWAPFDDGESAVTDLANASLPSDKARPVMIITGTDYY